MLRYPFIILIVLSTVFGCSRPDEEPEFRGISEIRLGKVKDSKVQVSAKANFFNPNAVGMKLKKVDMRISMDGRQVGIIDEEHNLRIPSEEKFSVPLNATFDLKEIGLLNGLFTVLGGRPLPLQFDGDIVVSVHGYRKKVPVSFKEDVRF